ncbi:MAG: quinolinate synthase NadA [Bacteroidales bacterium]
MSNPDYTKEIEKLKREKNAVILAHYYQTSDIQDIADYVGDSLGLARQAEQVEADMIVFAGVHFMAETAKILNPETKVVLPDYEASCSLAEAAPKEKFKAFIEQYPAHKVVSYVNSTAEVKTMSDIVCTSGNAVDIVQSFDKDQKLIFAPDKNLGAWVNKMTGRDMVLYEGTCEVHDILTTAKILKMKVENPQAPLIAHPECQPQVLEAADFIGSTTKLLNYTKNSDASVFIVATETGITHQMKKESPGKKFMIVPADETCACNDCRYMKMNTMEKLYQCMINEKPEIMLDEQTIEMARKPIDRMISLSKKLGLIK